MKLQLEMDLPEHLVDKALGKKAMAKAREEIVLDLFAQRKIRVAFSTSLRFNETAVYAVVPAAGVSLVDYTAEDLTTDLAVMDKLRTEHTGKLYLRAAVNLVRRKLEGAWPMADSSSGAGPKAGKAHYARARPGDGGD